MSMLVDLDYEESLNQIAPEGEYGIRLTKDAVQGISASSQKPMVTCEWEPFDPPPHVTMDQIQKCKIMSWISLQPNALFTLKEVLHAAKSDLICKACNQPYSAEIDRCPSCQSTKFSADLGVLKQGLEIGAYLKPGRNQKNTRDVTEIVKYFQRP